MRIEGRERGGAWLGPGGGGGGGRGKLRWLRWLAVVEVIQVTGRVKKGGGLVVKILVKSMVAESIALRDCEDVVVVCYKCGGFDAMN